MSMFLTSLLSILCLVVHVLCVYVLRLLSGYLLFFLWDKVWIFCEDRLATLTWS